MRGGLWHYWITTCKMDMGEVHDPLKTSSSPLTTFSSTTKTSFTGSMTRFYSNNSTDQFHSVNNGDMKRIRRRGCSCSVLSTDYGNEALKLRWEERSFQETGVADERAAMCCHLYPTPDVMQPLLSVCPRCGDHLSTHTVTNLNVGDTSRNVVERIFRTSWMKPDMDMQVKIEQVLKINNMSNKLSMFEEYRRLVKAKAKLQIGKKENPRCLVDGNEHLRFYGTTLECSLVTGLCSSPTCQICTIVCSGFSTISQMFQNQELERAHHHAMRGRDRIEIGFHSSATSDRAHEEANRFVTGTQKRAMVVCRVIAGRIHHSPESRTITGNDDKALLVAPPGFDSIASSAGPYYNIEDLLVFDPSAILPCFIVVYSYA